MKKNVFYICSLITITLLFVSNVEAGLHRLQMGFEYKSVNYEAISFNLYCNGVLVHNIDSSYREAELILDTNELYLTFTMTSIYADKPESPHSKPFYFTADSPSVPSAPKGFQIGVYLKTDCPVSLLSTTSKTYEAYQLNTYAKKASMQSSYFFEKDFTTMTIMSPLNNYSKKANLLSSEPVEFSPALPKHASSLIKYAFIQIDDILIKNV